MLKAFEDSGVSYVVVGGVAVVLHGHVRLTADIDIVVSLEETNAAKAIQCLENLGLKPRVPVDAKDFAIASKRKQWIEEKGLRVFSMIDPGNPFVTVDLFVESPVDFAELLSHSVLIEAMGGKIRVCSLEDLIKIKEQAGRPQDLLDVEALKIVLEGKNERSATF